MYNKLWVIILGLMLISWTGEGSGWIFSVDFQRIEAGSFTVESQSTGESKRLGGLKQDDNKVSVVTISESFEIMAEELTQEMWFRVKRENPSYFKKPRHCDDHKIIDGVEMCPNNPVESVSWDDVQDYIKELNDSMGLTGCNGRPDDANECYRLPTDAEWQYVARAGSFLFLWWYSSHLGDYVWYGENSGARTHKVGLKASNPWGLHDIYGNVWEWVQDRYSKELPVGKDPLNKNGSRRVVIRGGSWSCLMRSSLLRSMDRNSAYPEMPSNLVGFRLVRNL